MRQILLAYVRTPICLCLACDHSRRYNDLASVAVLSNQEPDHLVVALWSLIPITNYQIKYQKKFCSNFVISLPIFLATGKN